MSKQQDELKLLCDLTVVKLGKKLRILGFDTEIIKTVNQQTFKELLKDTKRTLVTKSKKLANACGGILITKNKTSEQLEEIFIILKNTNTQLSNNLARCVYCNEVLVDCPKEEVIGRVPVYIFETLEHFKCCPKCGKVYWRGTHLVKCKEFFASRGKETDM
jgi:uncharacterized protein with PIN domain